MYDSGLKGSELKGLNSMKMKVILDSMCYKV